MTLHHMLRCVAIMLMLVATQRNARIDSDPILAFLCFASLRLIAKKAIKVLIRNICVSLINETQGLASHCEPSLICNSGIQLQRTGRKHVKRFCFSLGVDDLYSQVCSLSLVLSTLVEILALIAVYTSMHGYNLRKHYGKWNYR